MKREKRYCSYLLNQIGVFIRTVFFLLWILRELTFWENLFVMQVVINHGSIPDKILFFDMRKGLE